LNEAEFHEAACACGGLRLRLRGEPEYVSSCACQACQRRTGAPFGVTAYYAQEQVAGEAGEPRTWRRIAESGNALVYRFCGDCGSTLWWDAEARPGKVCVAAGTFADKAYPPPQRMIWTDYKADWVRPPAGAPEYPRAP
jgi:hypothetical protein